MTKTKSGSTMKAVLINIEGFRKELEVAQDSACIVLLRPFEIKHVDDLRHEMILDDYKIYYHRERSFVNEYDKIVIIYRQER